ncbi:MAG: D-alanyl-D-alanine carboxypeptidase, partial [Oscillospiraceae bacterium]
HTEPRTVQHTNNLLDKGSKYYYENAKTGKTGTLDESGRCLVSTASKNGYNYLLVTLNSPIKDSEGNKIFSNFTDAKNLYEWAFKYFSYTTLLSPNEEIDEIPVKFSSGNDYILIKPSEEYTALCPSTIDFSSIQREIKITDEEIIAPIKKGAKLGTMTLSLSGETLKTVDLVAADGVERSSLKYNLAAAKKFFSSGWFTTGLIIAIILAIIYIILYSALTRKRRRKMKRVKKNRQF